MAPLLHGSIKNGLYQLKGLQSSNNKCAMEANSVERVSSDTWHARFGHPQHKTVRNLLNSFSLPCSSSSASKNKCSACFLGKTHRNFLPITGSVSEGPLDLIFSDVWGPAPTLSTDAHRYFIIFIDDFSKYTWLFSLKNRSEVPSIFIKFQNLVERQFSTKIKQFQSDWGGEYRKLNQHFASCGIIHRVACPHTHEQNGAAERKIRHIVDTGLTLLSHATLPLKFWQFSFETATFLINRLPTPLLNNISPLQTLFNKPPDYSFFKTFGCAAFPWLRPYNSHKFSFRTRKCVFLGYSPQHLGYRCLDVESGRFYFSRHIDFIENEFPYTTLAGLALHPSASSSMSPWLTISTTNTPSELTPVQHGLCPGNHHSSSPLNTSTTVPFHSPSLHDTTSTSLPTQDTSFPPLSNFPITLQPPSTEIDISNQETITNSPSPAPTSVLAGVAGTELLPPVVASRRTHTMELRANPKPSTKYPLPQALLSHTVTNEQEPSCFTAANKLPQWRHAMVDEINALLRNGTWSLVPPSAKYNVVGSKWVYRIKRKADGSLDRYKARLVAKGYNQQEGIDYSETFSPVVKPTTIRTVLSLTTSHNWVTQQLDVSNAFLHGKLDEEVYMAQPSGFVDSDRPTHVCKLHKSLYGLKQAPRAWFMRLSSFLFTLGFVGSNTDSSLFISKTSTDCLYILVYVDDIVITGSNSARIRQTITSLGREFAIEDLGTLH